MPTAELLIVGAGFAGAMLAVHTLRNGGSRVTLIDRGDLAGRGLAYARAAPHHLLNVRSGRMSAYPDAPAHFAEWLGRRGIADAGGFASRRAYGDYLRETLADAAAGAPDRVRLVDARATGAQRTEDGWSVALDDGRRLAGDALVLALGNLPPDPPYPFADLPAGVYRNDPWGPDLAEGLGADDVAVLLGTGLTTVDAVLSLDEAGFAGRIVAMSRRGLLPRAHAEGAAHAHGLDVFEPMDLSLRLGAFRRRADAIGWRDAVDELRPITQGLWAASDPSTRDRFLRHLRPWWDVHRHRLAPQVHARVERMRTQGRLEVLAARTIRVEAGNNVARLTYRLRGSDEARTVDARRIVNCTGPSGDIARSADPLIRNLLAAGAIRADPHRLGIDVNGGNAVLARDGAAWPDLWAVGPIARGRSWEMTAVPDLRGQAAAMAQAIAAAATRKAEISAV